MIKPNINKVFSFLVSFVFNIALYGMDEAINHKTNLFTEELGAFDLKQSLSEKTLARHQHRKQKKNPEKHKASRDSKKKGKGKQRVSDNNNSEQATNISEQKTSNQKTNTSAKVNSEKIHKVATVIATHIVNNIEQKQQTNEDRIQEIASNIATQFVNKMEQEEASSSTVTEDQNEVVRGLKESTAFQAHLKAINQKKLIDELVQDLSEEVSEDNPPQNQADTTQANPEANKGFCEKAWDKTKEGASWTWDKTKKGASWTWGKTKAGVNTGVNVITCNF